MSVTGHIRTAPARCDEYGYGLGRPSGILVFRYRSAGAMEFGANRQDFLHQLYWSPDGMLSTVYGRHSRFVGPQEAFWSERAVNHEVRAADRQTVYRICLRQTPEALTDLRIGPVEVGREAARLIQMIGSPGCGESEALIAREQIMAALLPSPCDVTALGATGHGHALAVARVLSHDPGDATPLDEWAARLHISTKTLQRDFLREFGMSYTHWRTGLRLRTARVLLGTEPVTTVARRVGYASPSAFVMAFAKEYGLTPGRYLRNLRESETI
ncbi:AraC family transcriptional regulator [Streptomyces albipurpureus]|uniref:Helix-turn-helix domain-containing protein n=1 Tax=Streptomyces albipurpureus TaxID=2897419 RepID=A0ABT0UM17_9ACTN|nr:AraC family transcriptional regulator [Streptomyces sp. CWNU-1]MCM2389667.1 helix-turn-helix domain-containing protein [Streptomyces sp. CWNU-1]